MKNISTTMLCHSINLGIDGRLFQHNPFGTVGSLGAEDQQQAGNQSVCSLQSYLQLAGQTDKLVIFDLYRPPRGHPYRNTWIQHTLEVIQNESSINSSQVRQTLWFSCYSKASFIPAISPFSIKTQVYCKIVTFFCLVSCITLLCLKVMSHQTQL